VLAHRLKVLAIAGLDGTPLWIDVFTFGQSYLLLKKIKLKKLFKISSGTIYFMIYL